MLAVSAGCGQVPGDTRQGKADATTREFSDSIALVKPVPKMIRLSVRQPGTIQAFERTPIFAKIAGYVRKWNVDRGDYVKKDAVLAELDVPELLQELKQKQEIVTQAQEAAEVAAARVATASARIKESQAGVVRAEKNHQFWQLQYDRLTKLTTTVDAQTRDEAWNQMQAAAAGLKEAEAKVETSQAALKEAEAVQRKAKADIGAAEVDRDRVAALVSYTRLKAPYDGVVTRRNVNTDDFVQPPTGGKGEPLYIVERRDRMRVVVEVPEMEAAWVAKDAPARIRVQGLQGQEFVGAVARTSYSIVGAARTLVTEIDLENPHDRLRPGYYVIAAIRGEHRAAFALPASAVLTQGDVTQGYQRYCFVIRAGKAERLLVQVGLSDGNFVEVLRKRTSQPRENDGAWEVFTGDEEVAAVAARLTEGQSVGGK
jgi:multidrug efflux pump subunit AcrA (membrane-fusion protein)